MTVHGRVAHITGVTTRTMYPAVAVLGLLWAIITTLLLIALVESSAASALLKTTTVVATSTPVVLVTLVVRIVCRRTIIWIREGVEWLLVSDVVEWCLFLLVLL